MTMLTVSQYADAIEREARRQQPWPAHAGDAELAHARMLWRLAPSHARDSQRPRSAPLAWQLTLPLPEPVPAAPARPPRAPRPAGPALPARCPADWAAGSWLDDDDDTAAEAADILAHALR